MSKIRMFIAAMLAAGVTFALFLLMFKLISSGGSDSEEMEAIAGIHFGPVDIPDEIMTKNRRKPRKPPPPKNPPPAPKLQVSRVEQAVQDLPRLDLPDIDIPMSGGDGLYVGNFASIDKTEEGDTIPVVRVRPMYPREAAIKGQEGWVKVEFTVTATGTVKDPRVIDASPPRVFNREALRAISKWKFKPRVVDGVAVERLATQTIEFNLDPSGA